jgi:hypothetical protein
MLSSIIILLLKSPLHLLSPIPHTHPTTLFDFLTIFCTFPIADGSENLAQTLIAPPQNIWRGTYSGQFKLERIQVERANLYAHFYKECIERRT